jgi:putative transposase
LLFKALETSICDTIASRENVRRCFLGFSKIFSVGKVFRNSVAVDETLVELHAIRAYLSSAVEIDSGKILAVYASCSRNIITAMKFIRMVLCRCLTKPQIIVDRGPWYKWPLERFVLKHQYQRFGVRNTVEGFFGYLKQMTKRIYTT